MYEWPQGDFFLVFIFKFKTLCYRLKEAGICDFVEQTPLQGCFTCHTNTKCQSTDVLSHRWRWVTVKSFLTYKLPHPKPLGSIYTEDLAWLDILSVCCEFVCFSLTGSIFYFIFYIYFNLQLLLWYTCFWCIRPNVFILWIMYNFYPKIFRKKSVSPDFNWFFCLFQFIEACFVICRYFFF